MKAVKDPLSTITNLAYIVAGIFVISIAQDNLDRFFGAALCWLGFGSTAYHVMRKNPGLLWDRLGMYTTTPALMAITYREIFEFSSFSMLVVAVGIGAFLSIFEKYIESGLVLPVFVLAISIPLLFFNAAAAWTILAIFMFAFCLRQAADALEKIHFPAYDGLHAAWHILTGWGYWYAFTLITAP